MASASWSTQACFLLQVRSRNDRTQTLPHLQDLERKLSALRQQERELDSQQVAVPQKKQQRSQVHHC